MLFGSSNDTLDAFIFLFIFVAVGVVMFTRDKNKAAAAAASLQVKHDRANKALGVTGPAASRVKRIPGFHYLGGHPVHEEPQASIVLVVTDTRLAVETADTCRKLFSVPLEDLSDLLVETQEEVQQRVTASRLLLVGVFAFAWKKRTGGSIIATLDTPDGPLMFERREVSKAGTLVLLAPLRKAIAARRAQPGSPAPDGPAPAGPARTSSSAPTQVPASETPPVSGDGQQRSTVERLKHVDELHETGVISAEEHATQRSRILGDL